MTRRFAQCSAGVVVLTLAITVAYAGGWSIITVHDVPDYSIAGRSLTLTFSVRQHGNNLLEGLRPTVRATTPQGLETNAIATPAKGNGEYSATLNFPQPGEWSIRIDGGFNPEDKTRSFNAVTLLPLKVVRNDQEAPVVSKSTRGAHLFVAKGCVGCHNSEGKLDLTQKQFGSEYLKKFLADPSSVRKVDMPNLNLKEDEIASLSAYLTGSVFKQR